MGPNETRVWFYIKDRQQYGPVGFFELTKLLEQGVLNGETYLWTIGSERWEMAKNIERFKDCNVKKPPQVSSPSETMAQPRNRPFLRFLLGGAAVVLSTIISRKLGEKAGGIFAAFPAVYLAALLTNRLSFTGNDLISHSILLSKGAIMGMSINILIAILAGYLLKKGWKRGLVNSLVCWLFLSFVVVIITSH